MEQSLREQRICQVFKKARYLLFFFLQVTNDAYWMNYSQQIGCSEKYVGEGMAVVFDLLILEKLNLQLVNSGRKVCSRLILPLIHLLKPFMGRVLCHFSHALVWYSCHMLAHSLRSPSTQVIKENGMLFLYWFFYALIFMVSDPTHDTQTKYAQNHKTMDLLCFYVIKFSRAVLGPIDLDAWDTQEEACKRKFSDCF